MNYLFVVVIFIILFRHLKKESVYNPYDEALSNSSYYNCSYIKKETCTDDICRLLQDMSGHKRLLRNFCYEREIREGSKKRRKTRLVKDEAEILLIHEAGVFVINSQNLEGNIRGNADGRYWIQSLRDGRFMACRNFIVNPFLENKRVMDLVRWQCRDITKLPFYSLAVFGRKGVLETEGYMEENKWAVTSQTFPTVMAEITRQKRRFLKPEEIELVYERLMEVRV